MQFILGKVDFHKNVDEKINEYIMDGRLINNGNSYDLGCNAKGRKIETLIKKTKRSCPSN